jgi:hypothetical protein
MRALAAFLVLATGCTGQWSNAPIEDEPPTCGAPVVGIARLTRDEYNRSIRDLLGPGIGEPANELPVDEEVSGLELRGGRLVPLVADQLYTIAEDASERADLSTLVSCDPSSGEECARTFIASFGERAYRRPVTGEERDRLLAVWRSGSDAGSFEEGIRWTLAAMLVSPAFLYHGWNELGTPHAPGDPMRSWVVASRLSYLMFGTAPDDALRDVARSGGLDTSEQIEAQTRALLEDPRAHEGVLRFFRAWLQTERIRGVSKDPNLFPEYTPELATDLQRSVDAFVEHAVWEGGFRALFEGDTVFVNERIAAVYGASASGEELVPVSLGRAGLLGQPGIMAMLATPHQGHPIRRGLFVREHLLCDDIPPPPPGVEVVIPALDVAPTTRERFETHTQGSCASCHRFLDPIGFSLEGYDAIGRVRTEEAGQPIDDTGAICDFPNCEAPIEIQGHQELAHSLAADPRTQRCLTREWMRFALHAPVESIDRCELDRVSAVLAESDDLADLLVAIATSDLIAGQTEER